VEQGRLDHHRRGQHGSPVASQRHHPERQPVEDAAHLLNRAGFSGPPAEIESLPLVITDEPEIWRELGLGLFGAAGDFDWRVFVVNGLDGSGFDSGGLRGGRQKGSKALAEDFALTGRLDWTGVPGLELGAAGYYGDSGQGLEDPGAPGETIGAATLIIEGHAGFRWRGLDLRGLVAHSTVDDVAALNAANGITGDASIGESLTGWYLQGGYDVLRPLHSGVQLLPYVRYEWIDTQQEVPDGFASDPANDQTLLTLGAQVLPIPNLAAKADYTFASNQADTGVDRFSVSLSYMF